MNKDLVAASAEPLLLSILSKKENYGYAIIKEVHVLSNGKIEWTEGMLYLVLHRLEKNGFIKASWKLSDTGRKRKYYKIQKKGARRLKSQLEEWSIASSAIDASCGAANV